MDEKEEKVIGVDEENPTEKIPVCLTIYEEMNTSESDSDSEESIEDRKDSVDRIRVECGEHSRLARLSPKIEGSRKERRISIKNGERKISIKSVKVF